MLVGGYASDPTYRMARLVQAKDVPFLICTASADKITRRDWENIYRLNPPISEYTQGLEDFWIKNFKRQNSVNTLVLQIIDGKFETVWPPEVASTQFALPNPDRPEP